MIHALLGKNNFLRLTVVLGCCFCFCFCAASIVDEESSPITASSSSCDGSAASWGDSCKITDEAVIVVENATAWWYENIEPFVPENQKEYYQEPFGGATQPSAYRTDLVKIVLNETNEQGVTYTHVLGGRTVGTRAPLHRHDFGATSHVLQGYVTLFLEGSPPVTYGPGESYYMPPGGKVMAAAVVPKPVLNNGTQIVQPYNYSKNIDTNAVPVGERVTIFVEREIISSDDDDDNDGEEYFYWLTDVIKGNAYKRCPELPRYACQNDDFDYDQYKKKRNRNRNNRRRQQLGGGIVHLIFCYNNGTVNQFHWCSDSVLQFPCVGLVTTDNC